MCDTTGTGLGSCLCITFLWATRFSGVVLVRGGLRGLFIYQGTIFLCGLYCCVNVGPPFFLFFVELANIACGEVLFGI